MIDTGDRTSKKKKKMQTVSPFLFFCLSLSLVLLSVSVCLSVPLSRAADDVMTLLIEEGLSGVSGRSSCRFV